MPRDLVRIQWLENNIVWKPMDGQHINDACKQTQQEYQEEKMLEDKYQKRFA